MCLGKSIWVTWVRLFGMGAGTPGCLPSGRPGTPGLPVTPGIRDTTARPLPGGT